MPISEQTIDAFLADIASDRVSPAGGTGAAVGSAIGTALCEMVCIHTLEHGASGEVPTGFADLRDDLRIKRTRLLRLAETDASLVDNLFSGSASGMDQSDVQRLVGVPLTIAETSLDVLEVATDVVEHGSPTAVPDAVTGVFLVRAALRASRFTARRNVRQLSDDSHATDVENEIAEIGSRGDEAYEAVMRSVDAQM